MKRALGLLFMVVAAQVGCSSPGVTKQYAADSLLLPLPGNGNFDYDLDGDGQPDNKLSLILIDIMALMNGQLDLQTPVTLGIQRGLQVILLDEHSSDPKFKSDSSASSHLFGGISSPTSPRFDGSDHFTKIIYHDSGAHFVGHIRNGLFSSSNSATMTSDVNVFLPQPNLGLNEDGPRPVLSIHGAHIQYTYQNGKLVGGQLNGAIKAADIVTDLLPEIFSLVQEGIAEGYATTTLLSLFDNGGSAPSCNSMSMCINMDGITCRCMKPDGTCAGQDGIIDECEVATNPTLLKFLQPDVQLFSADGKTYKPNPKPNKVPDSLSLGIGFTAVSATFSD